MSEHTTIDAGVPSWVDLSATDPAAAKDFYAKVFGWTYQDVPTPQGVYSVAMVDGKTVSGIMEQPPNLKEMGAPSVWNTYVTVDDCDASTEKAKSSGATVAMEPMDVMEFGRMSVIQDPTGAFVCLWQAVGSSDEVRLFNEHGAFTWTELLTGDQEAAASFYSGLFGWQAQDMQTPDGQDAKIFTLGDGPVASTRGLPMEGVPPNWFNYFAHDDVDAAVGAISEAGGTVMMEPFDTPPGRIAVAQDNTGGSFAVITLNPDFSM